MCHEVHAGGWKHSYDKLKVTGALGCRKLRQGDLHFNASLSHILRSHFKRQRRKHKQINKNQRCIYIYIYFHSTFRADMIAIEPEDQWLRRLYGPWSQGTSCFWPSAVVSGLLLGWRSQLWFSCFHRCYLLDLLSTPPPCRVICQGWYDFILLLLFTAKFNKEKVFTAAFLLAHAGFTLSMCLRMILNSCPGQHLCLAQSWLFPPLAERFSKKWRLCSYETCYVITNLWFRSEMAPQLLLEDLALKWDWARAWGLTGSWLSLNQGSSSSWSQSLSESEERVLL